MSSPTRTTSCRTWSRDSVNGSRPGATSACPGIPGPTRSGSRRRRSPRARICPRRARADLTRGARRLRRRRRDSARERASTVSLMASPYRAAAFARAHNEWVREQWLDGEPRLRGSILCPAQDPLAGAREIQRAAAADDRFVEVLLCAGPSVRTASRDICRFSRPRQSVGSRSRSTRAAREWASRPPAAVSAPTRSISNGTRSVRRRV